MKFCWALALSVLASSAYADIYCTQTENADEEIYFDFYAETGAYEMYLQDLDYWGDALLTKDDSNFKIEFDQGVLTGKLDESHRFQAMLVVTEEEFPMTCHELAR